MALVRYATLGQNRFKLCVLNDDSLYIYSVVAQKAGDVINSLCTSMGTDMMPILANNRNGVLVTFSDGAKITYVTSPRTYVENNINTYFIYDTQLYYIDKNGGKSTLINTSLTEAIHWGQTDTYTNYHCYFALAIDESSKLGYLSFIYTNKNGGAGTYTFFCDVPPYGYYSLVYSWFAGGGAPIDPDPWSNSGYADVGGGDGELDLTSDPIILPTVPTSFSATGLIQLFCPTLQQVQSLSNYLWSSSFLDNVLKLFNNPMDIIISLSMIPYPLTPTGTRLVYAGNVVTTVDMDYTDKQYIIIDCGSLAIKNFYKSYIDYEPFTTCEIFLPYIGYQKISIDEIMGKTINVTYRVDLLTGLCSAYITADGILLYTFSGSCASIIPVSNQSYNSVAQSVLTIATSTALAVKPAKVGVPPANTNYSNDMTKFVAANSLASNVLSCKPDIQRSGSVSSNIGILGAQKPYLIFTVPRVCLPKGQNKYIGYPSFMSVVLSTLTGFTVVEEIRLNNLTCTEDEKDEIMQLLKGGVIL